MRIPEYDDLRVGLNQLQAPAMRSGEVQDTASRQITAAGQSLQRAGQDLTKHVLELQQEVNDTMLMGRLNLIKEHAIELEHNQQTGFRMLKGDQALTRPDNMALEDEYGNALQKFIDQQGEGLAPAVLSRYREQAGNMVNGLRERAMVHRNGEYANYRAKQYEAIIGTASREIAINPGDEKVLEGAASRIGSTIERMAALAGHPPEWVEATKRTAMSGALKGAIVQLMDDDPHRATVFMEKHLDKMDYQDVVVLRGQLEEARIIYDGLREGDALYEVGGGYTAQGGRIKTGNRSLDFILSLESAGGTLNVRNLEGTSSASGIGQFTDSTWLGEVKAAKPAWANGKTDKELLALRFDKEKSLEMMGTHIARLRRNLQVNGLPVNNETLYAMYHFGPDRGKRFARASGDTPMSEILTPKQLQSNKYLIGKTKDQALANWNSRAGGAGRQTLTGKLQRAQTIEDPRKRDIAMRRLKERWDLDKATDEENYSVMLQGATDKAYARPGGWADIPRSEWAQIKPEHRASLMAGPPKQSDPNLLLEFMTKPELQNPQEVLKRRHMLSEGDVRSLVSTFSKPSRDAESVSIMNNQFQDMVIKSGVKLDKEEEYQLRAALEQQVYAKQQALGRKLTMDEMNQLTTQLLRPHIVKSGSWWPFNKERPLFQISDPSLIQISAQQQRQIREAFVQKYGREPLYQEMLQYYLRGQ